MKRFRTCTDGMLARKGCILDIGEVGQLNVFHGLGDARAAPIHPVVLTVSLV